ncbi:cytochrome C [Salipiger aestuarii]|uniref:Cytochrome c553 n=1 Tax=Salipiger aestuarii TaxID=568098 RepID=A0A327Y9Z9_9RHOB|nr:c-type cytochrome [Salipiger aestuarii]KAB2541719.1 cytochrome C [Salipiger aestuarii]RAK15309.1 cytochrome c553 [Salipiger aestuarii]
MRRWIYVAVAAAVIGGSAFYWLGAYNIAASKHHLPGVGPVLHQYMRNVVTTRGWGVSMPDHVDLDDPGLIRLGAGHFATGCLTCHGGPGIPRNPVVLGMQPEPPMLTGDYRASEYWWIARHGFKYTGMPAWPGEGRDDEPWALAAFLSHYDQFDRAAFEEAAFGRTAGYESAAVRFAGQPGAIPSGLGCARCHGEDGLGRDGTAPKLAGQSEAWLTRALTAYADGHRESGFMEPLAAPLGNETIAGVAAHYAEMGGDWQGRALPMGDAARGRTLARQGSEHGDIASCTACHGADRRNDTPRIAGQDGYWIVNWLHMYRDGPIPDTPRAHLMAAAAKALDDEDILDLAAWYAQAPDPREISPPAR